MANDPHENENVRLALLETRLKELKDIMDLKIGRIVSDIESEKDTRARVNEDWKHDLMVIRKDLRAIEKNVWIGIGIITTLQFIVPLLINFLRK